MPALSDRTIAVVGSGLDEHEDLARPVGELLALGCRFPVARVAGRRPATGNRQRVDELERFLRTTCTL